MTIDVPELQPLPDLLYAWDPQWAGRYAQMIGNPFTNGIPSTKDALLILVGVSGSVTNMDAGALRRAIRDALRAGATRDEILEVLKMTAVVALHSMSLGAPILIEETKAADKSLDASAGEAPATPTCDKMREIGQWNQAWEPFYQLDPLWTEQFIAAGAGFYTSGVLSPKFVELISIGIDAAITHMYAPGVRRHIAAALRLGATVDEVMSVLKICVSQGGDALRLAVPILAEETDSGDRATTA
jgi:alkylhydroperoxidase/carboxymuconolactone decarboxylase family protein YurZ